MRYSLADIKLQVDKLAAKIQAPEYLLPTYGSSEDGARPHIEIDRPNKLFYIVVERGEEIRKDYATELNDLLYMIFSNVTFSMACDYELKHRIESQDFRRILFAKQEELLGFLKPDWQTREHEHHKTILKSHSFRDDLS